MLTRCPRPARPPQTKRVTFPNPEGVSGLSDIQSTCITESGAKGRRRKAALITQSQKSWGIPAALYSRSMTYVNSYDCCCSVSVLRIFVFLSSWIYEPQGIVDCIAIPIPRLWPSEMRTCLQRIRTRKPSLCRSEVSCSEKVEAGFVISFFLGELLPQTIR